MSTLIRLALCITYPRARRARLTDKEAWRATAEDLFAQQAAALADTFTVEEFWAMDCLNHGRSAVSNDARLGEYPDGFSKSARPVFAVRMG